MRIFRKTAIPFFIIRDSCIPLQIDTSSRKRTVALQKAMNWLCYAQDKGKDGGVSEGYDLRKGWLPPFPETTGYIIPTFLDYYHFTGEKTYKERALKMLEWLLSVQEDNGAISGIIEGARSPLVFDTGQVLFGFVRGYKETKEECYLEAAKKAGDWLVSIQDRDGKWSENVYQNILHSYNVRVAWALLELNKILPQKKYFNAANRNITWTLTQQQDNGWFKHNTFEKTTPVYTHALGYVTRGILEAGILLNNRELIFAAQKTADRLLSLQRKNGALPATFDSRWNPTASSVCLTGSAQVGIVWLRLYQITKDLKYLKAAKLGNSFLIKTQERIPLRSFEGAIKGSHPIHGNYLTFVYPNWAAKFFVDVLLLEINVTKKNKLKKYWNNTDDEQSN